MGEAFPNAILNVYSLFTIFLSSSSIAQSIAMADSILYSEDMYVFLTPDSGETFLTPQELLSQLEHIIQTYPEQLPKELTAFSSLTAQAKYLLDTRCEFETAPGESVQWYAVRLEK